MARRLIGLERERLAESRVLDQNARRILHDDVLPRLHTAMLQLDGGQAASDGSPTAVVALLGQIHHQLAHLLTALPTSIAPEVDRLGFVNALRQVVEGELANSFDEVTWHLEPAAVEVVAGSPRFAGDVLFCAAREALRNAARHARGGDLARPLRADVCLTWAGDHVQLAVEDDGVGFGNGAKSTLGGGQGLAVHSTLLTIVGGTLTIQPSQASGTRVALSLPGSVAASTGEQPGGSW
jgi:signal transduction histidine kinase